MLSCAAEDVEGAEEPVAAEGAEGEEELAAAAAAEVS